MTSIKKKKLKIMIMSLLILSIFTLSVVKSNEELETITTSVNLDKKIGWGIKRNDNHEQPDVGKENRSILEENGGICLGNSEKKYIYLTFDEGYESGYTAKILDILKENDVKATFFITAHYLNTEEDLVKRMIDEGHIVGNHTPKFLMSGISKNKKNLKKFNLYDIITKKLDRKYKKWILKLLKS